jgi:NADH:ubiquinone oxidoreductase subunit C
VTSVRPEARAGHIVRLVAQRLGPGMLEGQDVEGGEDVAIVPRDRLLVLLHLLRDDPDADMRLLLDVTAVDHGPTPPASDDDDERAEEGDERQAEPERPRFEVLYRLRSPRLGYRALIVVPVPESDPSVPSATGLFPAAEWLERELWEMFGIYPDGHPYLRPLLLYSGFAGHPLRRDYPRHKAQPLVPLRSDLAEPEVVGEPGDDHDGHDDAEVAG